MSTSQITTNGSAVDGGAIDRPIPPMPMVFLAATIRSANDALAEAANALDMARLDLGCVARELDRRARCKRRRDARYRHSRVNHHQEVNRAV